MENYTNIKTLFQNLSDINRLKIIFFIGTNEVAVGEIVEFLGLSQPLVSHHLRKLRDCNILSTKRHGPFIKYHLTNNEILKTIELFNEINKTTKNV